MFEKSEILVTGGTGSFGQALVPRILTHHKPKRIVVFSRDEHKQYEMSRCLRDACVQYFIGDMRDLSRLRLAADGVDYIVHAAALKHVPVAEEHPIECVKTNIDGAQNLIQVALEAGAKAVLALSTDKAVNPTSVYGATKLVSDRLFVTANNIGRYHKTRFSVVRCGNVLRSRGSIVPEVERLASLSERVLVTDKRMTRCWITLEHSTQFVLECFRRMHGGEIFLPKMYSSRVIDLIRAISPSSEHKIVGCRPGERLHEIMCSLEESARLVEFPDHFVITPSLLTGKQRNYLKNKNGETGVRITLEQEHRSDTNPRRLEIDALQKLLLEGRQPSNPITSKRNGRNQKNRNSPSGGIRFIERSV